MTSMPAFTTNAMTLALLVNFPWLSVDVRRLPSFGIYISQLVQFARCFTCILDFHLKIFKSLQIFDSWLRISEALENFRSSSERLFKCGEISFQEFLKESRNRSSTVIYFQLMSLAKDH